ncbi:MAG: LysM peptidoglycan-binding domain-containing protein, partial [Alphaproteobacteria bacterium]|nr:LysM peptidoglycan-binding domain-containing protein [Alphaproteobacteria bacterium]
DGTTVAVSEDDAAVTADDEMVAATDVSTVEDGTAVTTESEDDATVMDDGEMMADADAAPLEDGTTVAVSEDDAAVTDGDEMTAATDVSTVEDGTAATTVSEDDATVTDDGDVGMEEDAEAGPDFDVVRVETTGDAVMAGSGEPGATIVVTSGDDVVGETVADAAGDWVIVTEEPLDSGAHELKLSSVNGEGETTHSDTIVVVSVPQEPTGDEADDVLTVMMDDEDGGGVEVIQGGEEGIGISGGGDLALDSLSYDEEGNVSMGGQATPGDTVVVYVDDHVAGVADAEDGEWTVALDDSVGEGTHSLRVDEINEEGDVVARLETPFVRASFVMPEASDRLIVIQPGNNLWRIARRTYGRGILYTLIYEANRNQIADPHLIYPGQIFVMPQDRVAEN